MKPADGLMWYCPKKAPQVLLLRAKIPRYHLNSASSNKSCRTRRSVTGATVGLYLLQARSSGATFTRYPHRLAPTACSLRGFSDYSSPSWLFRYRAMILNSRRIVKSSGKFVLKINGLSARPSKDRPDRPPAGRYPQSAAGFPWWRTGSP